MFSLTGLGVTFSKFQRFQQQICKEFVFVFKNIHTSTAQGSQYNNNLNLEATEKLYWDSLCCISGDNADVDFPSRQTLISKQRDIMWPSFR